MYALFYNDDRIDFYFRKRRSAVEEKLNLTLTVTAFQRPESKSLLVPVEGEMMILNDFLAFAH